jgi:two-component system KDP operon response regulator KdpE
MISNSRVLVIGQKSQGSDGLEQVLAGQGYSVRTAAEGPSALSSLDEWRPHLVFTEKHISPTDVVDLCRRIRSVSKVPVIVLSEGATEEAKVEALDSGADDYVTRPYNSVELLARARAVLRRSIDDGHEPPLESGAFRIDFSSRRVHIGNREVRLTPKEFDLLVYLARHPNRVIEHKRLLTAVWGEQGEEHPEYLRVFIGQLRKKVEDDPARPRYLLTEAWVGYRLNPAG